MIDVETRARRAGEAARAEAAARVRHLEVPTVAAARRSPRWSVGRPVLGALAGAAIVLLVVLVIGQLTPPRVPTIEPAVPDLAELVDEPVAIDGVLPVPPVGEVLPAYLEDGTPVFVSHPEDGEVLVLGATNPHRNGWLGKLVAYCPSSGWFEDLIHGARFNAWGDWTGGPAPAALPDHHAVVAEDGRSVRVTGEVDHTRSRNDRRAEVAQRGQNCDGGTPDGALANPVLEHEVPTQVPALDGTAIPADRWVWAEVRLGGAPGDPRACDLDGRCREHAPRLYAPPGWPTYVPADGMQVGLVRRTADGVRLLAPPRLELWEGRVAGQEDREWVSASALLPLPEPGQVLAEWYGPAAGPVFVARDEDGGVHVLDATSPARAASLVGWCPAFGAFVDDTGTRWAGTHEGAETGLGDGSWSDLGRYPAEIVTQGELSAVGVTGDLEREWAGATGDLAGPSDDQDCATEQLVRHLPRQDEMIREGGLVGGPEARWTWARMAIAEVDGQLRLCAVNGPEACGVPDVDHDPTNADCFDDIGPGGLCPPAEDPVVVTDGVSATDGAVLLLVRGSADGREVEVRLPATFDGA